MCHEGKQARGDLLCLESSCEVRATCRFPAKLQKLGRPATHPRCCPRSRINVDLKSGFGLCRYMRPIDKVHLFFAKALTAGISRDCQGARKTRRRLRDYKVRGLFAVKCQFTLSNLSPLNLVSISRCSSPPRNPVYARRVDPSVLAFNLSLHRHPYLCILCHSRFMYS